jgi:hypothetical protein
MSFRRSILNRLIGSWMTIVEAFQAIRQSRFRRLVYILPVLIVIGLLLFIVSSTGALAPFVYPLF